MLQGLSICKTCAKSQTYSEESRRLSIKMINVAIKSFLLTECIQLCRYRKKYDTLWFNGITRTNRHILTIHTLLLAGEAMTGYVWPVYMNKCRRKENQLKPWIFILDIVGPVSQMRSMIICLHRLMCYRIYDIPKLPFNAYIYIHTDVYLYDTYVFCRCKTIIYAPSQG